MYQIINETTIHGITKRVVVDKEIVYPTLQAAKDSMWHKIIDGNSIVCKMSLAYKNLEERKELVDTVMNDMSTYKSGQGASITTYEHMWVCSYYDTQIMEKWIIQELQSIHSNE